MMDKFISFLCFSVCIVVIMILSYFFEDSLPSTNIAETPNIIKDSKPITWQRPPGPVRVGLQIGHLNSKDLPDELSNIRNNTGTTGGGKTEREINQEIAESTANILSKYGIVVDILPATVPINYLSDAFISIHADGNLDSTKSGYKLASKRRDTTGRSKLLEDFVHNTYGLETNLPADPNITRNMKGYYAFSSHRYAHSVHAMTPAIILETGFLTSPKDQSILIHNQDKAIQGLANGILKFLNSIPELASLLTTPSNSMLIFNNET